MITPMLVLFGILLTSASVADVALASVIVGGVSEENALVLIRRDFANQEPNSGEMDAKQTRETDVIFVTKKSACVGAEAVMWKDAGIR